MVPCVAVPPIFALLPLLASPALAADPATPPEDAPEAPPVQPAAAEPPADEPAPAESPAAPVPVLVSAFQAGTPEASGIAALLEGIVAEALRPDRSIALLRVEDSPRFPEYDARTYMDACPRGDIVGCSLVMGDRVDARYAVTGVVLPLASGARVQVSIIDVADSRVAISYRAEIPEGGDAEFAAALVKVLHAVAAGRLGAVDDIRDEGVAVEDAETVDYTDEELAAQIAELDPELRAAEGVLSQPRQSISRPTFTLDDLALQNEEGLTAWEQVGLRPGEYLRYKNSGLPLYEWRDRATGHASELIVRAAVGWWRGPMDTLYYNRHAYNEQLTVVDSYSAQATRTKGAPTASGEIAFGVLPTLDVGVAGGWAPGTLLVDIAADGSAEGAEQTTTVYPPTWWAGLRAEVALLPAGVVHPAFGVGATAVPTPRIDGYIEMPAYADALPTSLLVYGSVWPGVQVRLANHVDVYARVPFDFRLAGETMQETRDTQTAALVPTPPAASADFTVAVQAGVQVRLFGRKPKSGPLRDAP